MDEALNNQVGKHLHQLASANLCHLPPQCQDNGYVNEVATMAEIEARHQPVSIHSHSRSLAGAMAERQPVNSNILTEKNLQLHYSSRRPTSLLGAG